MTLYALDAVDDAGAAARDLLWPFDLGRWARLALVVFFVGSSGVGFPFQSTGGVPSGGEAPSVPAGTPEAALPGGAELFLIGAIAAAIVLVVLAFLLVGSVMEFVFVESLRKETVRVRAYWSRYWRLGLRLFGFRLVVGLLSLAVFAALAFAVFGPAFLGYGGISVALVLLAIPVFLVVSIVTGLLSGFTTMFVVPIMLKEERGLLSAWRRFWPTLSGQWKQYAAYAVVGFVLQLAIGIAVSIVTVFVAVVAAIPLGVVGLVGVGLLSVAEVAGWAVIAVAVAVFVLAMLAFGLLAGVPAQTYLRYHALFVLGDTESDFDLIESRRRAIRE
ncbi:DUF7544 domain-containing protein [Halobellus rubicundus]|uniref:Glycerophosphoryl diester phosphodiesterase membrane domain-containing protein n=1 Tax=Halobellus rubicundus TaxID=2996466 RepID=A0ABD5MI47_9EURY